MRTRRSRRARYVWEGGERAYRAGDSFLIPASLGKYALEGGVLYCSYYPNVKKSEAELAALGVDLARVGGKPLTEERP